MRLHVPADHDHRDVFAVEELQHVCVQGQRIGQRDQGLDAPLQQHLERTREARVVVLVVCQKRQVTGVV